jgi:hypothetical protein
MTKEGVRSRSESNLKEGDLVTFLQVARDKGSFEAEATRRTLPDGRIQIGPFSTTDSPLAYLDTWRSYRGGFAGKEEVMCDGKAVWHRSYKAELLNEKYREGELHSQLSGVLRAALNNSPTSYRRGPDRIEVGDYVYESDFMGNISSFVGSERIFHGNEKIFILFYNGEVTD